MSSYKSFYAEQSDFIKPANLDAAPSPLTIKSVRPEDVFNPSTSKKERCLVAHFNQTPQKLVINMTRGGQIENSGHGDDYTAWAGISLVLGIGKHRNDDVIIVKSATKGAAPPAPQANAPGQQKPAGDNPTVVAYKAALNTALEMGVKTRHIDIDKTGKGQLAWFRTELESSVKIASGGDVPAGSLHPYAAKAYMEYMEPGAGDEESVEAGPDVFAQTVAAITQMGAMAGHVQVGIKWLCGGQMPHENEIDTILALTGAEGIDIKTTFEWIFKTAEAATREN